MLFYNNEQALRSVIKLAYFSYRDHYLKFEELPSGDGYADIVYLPKKTSRMPALVIELKWNQSAGGAIAQIKEKHYLDVWWMNDYLKKRLPVHLRSAILFAKAYILLNFLRINPYSMGIVPIMLQQKPVLLFQNTNCMGLWR